MHFDNWLKDNKLSLNVMKTHSMLISTKPKLEALKSKNESSRLKVHIDKLEVVQKTKYLGVIVVETVLNTSVLPWQGWPASRLHPCAFSKLDTYQSEGQAILIILHCGYLCRAFLSIARLITFDVFEEIGYSGRSILDEIV